MQYKITAFYNFVNLDNNFLEKFSNDLEVYAKENQILGLVILSNEGINSTSASFPDNLDKFEEFLTSYPEFKDTKFKRSSCNKKPFKRFKVKFRDEIVTIGRDDLLPDGKNGHLTPSEWNQILKSDQEYILLDTRNEYETKMGAFKNAICPDINMFAELESYLEKEKLPKDKKVLMYCTGGIRCEKASLLMQEMGYQDVCQLDGGILKYFEEFPNDQYEGECFVFDHRVSVKQDLLPTEEYDLCPHCGDPGKLKIKCLHCNESGIICDDCSVKDEFLTCSKNCHYHYNLKSDS